MRNSRTLDELWPLVKESVGAWIADYASSMGAALAYYTLFSIAPLLIIAIGLAGLFFGHEAAQGEIYDQLRGLIGPEGASAVEGLVKSASEPAKSTLATVVGVITLAIGATTVFAELQSDLDRIWDVPAAKSPSGIWNLIRSRVLSFGMVLGIGFLLFVSLLLSAALAALGKLWGSVFGEFEVLLQLVNFVVSLIVITGLFALMYKILPRVAIAWSDVWIGAAVTALLFSVGKFLIGLYIGKSAVVSGFGAAGSLVVLLIWVYYSAQIFLLGAEFTWAFAHRFGSRRHAKKTETPSVGRAIDQAPGPARTTPTPEVRLVPAPPVASGSQAPASGIRAWAWRRPALALGIAAALGLFASEFLERLARRPLRARTGPRSS
jgi:membrane protein